LYMLNDAGDDGGNSGAPEQAPQAHVVTEEEAAGASFSIDDVVLPLPGSSICYPDHATAQVYSTFFPACAAKANLQPKIFSLSSIFLDDTITMSCNQRCIRKIPCTWATFSSTDSIIVHMPELSHAALHMLCIRCTCSWLLRMACLWTAHPTMSRSSPFWASLAGTGMFCHIAQPILPRCSLSTFRNGQRC
jgi:hypothetical protein